MESDETSNIPVGRASAWFLGPKAENQPLFSRLISQAIEEHCSYRRSFHPEDPVVIDEATKWSASYQQGVARLEQEAQSLFKALRKSAPIFSMRHHGHMLWDQAIPAMVGYFAAMLYNQNNVAAEASPLTTELEIQVGHQLCHMLGFRPGGEKTVTPWGHITCGGSVANIEALWSARNAKYYAIAVREALRFDPGLTRARDIEVNLPTGRRVPLLDLDTWQLLNLSIDEVVALPYRINDEYGVRLEAVHKAVSPHAIQTVGLVAFQQRFLSDVPDQPAILVPATRHYSWDKASTLLGLGQNSIVRVPVDLDARMDAASLEKILLECLKARRPVLAAVAVIGSTQEGAVDPLDKIVACRGRLRERGLDFAIHCDAAWGGYFRSMLSDVDFAPVHPLSDHVQKQLGALDQSDSITVDPHKAGYVPYPAGALCYRNSRQRDLVSLGAPVIFHGESEPTVGIYGIEGSKPGAAAAAVYLAHQVIPQNPEGYGNILGQCVWTSKRLYCRLRTMYTPQGSARLRINVLQRLPAERAGKSEAEIEAQVEQLRAFVPMSDVALYDLLNKNPDERELFSAIGSDQVILAYSFNFRDHTTGDWNRSVKRYNTLNNRIFEICSISRPAPEMPAPELILTASAFGFDSYGAEFVEHYCKRLGLHNTHREDVSYLISTTMNPWSTDSYDGITDARTDFLATFVDALKRAVEKALTDLNY